jgi:hypothetical protein
MKYRILSNGKLFKVQYKSFLFWNDCRYDASIASNIIKLEAQTFEHYAYALQYIQKRHAQEEKPQGWVVVAIIKKEPLT